jgi:hypothetical protein
MRTNEVDFPPLFVASDVRQADIPVQNAVMMQLAKCSQGHFTNTIHRPIRISLPHIVHSSASFTLPYTNASTMTNIYNGDQDFVQALIQALARLKSNYTVHHRVEHHLSCIHQHGDAVALKV